MINKRGAWLGVIGMGLTIVAMLLVITGQLLGPSVTSVWFIGGGAVAVTLGAAGVIIMAVQALRGESVNHTGMMSNEREAVMPETGKPSGAGQPSRARQEAARTLLRGLLPWTLGMGHVTVAMVFLLIAVLAHDERMTGVDIGLAVAGGVAAVVAVVLMVLGRRGLRAHLDSLG